ncbi:trimeric intracellular cation channel family protein [Trueperella bialowiezensis]|uniref:Predicted membrane protein n=1 Tax=Trueperella bialowiezensis TaxID=312285 RepID=A0A448PCK8_9ACTO|nr:trimeric intracellular cation channel family protein [Trueperella bialowiezensis]VEI12683.1 Predicted membrane protein [Trueperella bialowiezensis]
MEPDVLFRIVDVVGVIAYGVLGASYARALNYDVIGYLFLGVITALGGGMIRDSLLGIGFPVALTDPWYLSGALGAAFVAYLIPMDGPWWRRWLLLADVLALGCWSATGASKGLAAGLAPIPSMFLGVITATAGGVIRDVVIGRRPAIFGSNPMYASFAILASGVMVIFQKNGLYEEGMALAILICLVFGLAAQKFNWVLPSRPLNVLETSTRQIQHHHRRLRTSQKLTRSQRRKSKERQASSKRKKSGAGHESNNQQDSDSSHSE